MTAHHVVIAPLGAGETDVTDRIRLPTSQQRTGFSVSTLAEGGGVGQATVTLDDKDKTLPFDVLRGRNGYHITEDASEDPDPTLFAGNLTERKARRGPYRTGVSRQWEAGVVDGNNILSRYMVMPDEDGDRDQETDEERITWLLGLSGAVGRFPSTDLLEFTDPVTMSDTDLTGRTYLDVLDDCARQSGSNFFLWWDGVDEEYKLAYLPETSELLTSPIRLTNVHSDVTGDYDNDTFEYSLETDLTFDPSRVASRVFARGQEIETMVTNETTEEEFGRVDISMDEPEVRKVNILKARALRYAGSLANEEEVISGTVELPASKVSQFRAGHRIQIKGTHWDGYEDFAWVRLTEVTPTQIAADEGAGYNDRYSVRFVCSPPTLASAGSGSGGGNLYAILRGVGRVEDGGLMHWAHTGDNPGAGYDERPTVGPFTFLTDSISAQRPYYGIQVDGDGTIDTINFLASAIGVRDQTQTYGVTFGIKVNGVLLESEVLAVPADSDHGVAGWGTEGVLVTATNVAVSNGDVITAWVNDAPPLIWQIPQGVGNFAERLELSGGTVV